MNWLEAQNLTLPLSGRTQPIFENRSIQVNENDRIAIQGPSGCGKTLFLRSLCLLESRLQGKVLWKGEPVIASLAPHYRAQVMYVGQKSVLSPGTVQTNFEEAFRLKIHRHKHWDAAQTAKDFELFNKRPDFLAQPVGRLSGGEKQLVHLLRAVALMPEVLCLDEPTSALDGSTAQRMESWLHNSYRGAWLWVTHSEEQAARIGTQTWDFGDHQIFS